MSKFYFYIFIFLYNICNAVSFSQGWGHAEIKIVNKTLGNIDFFLTPIGTVFSGHHQNSSRQFKYSFFRSNPQLTPNNWVFISGSLINKSTNVEPNDFRLIDFDDGDYNSSGFLPEKTAGGIGYGLWHLKFYSNPSEDENALFLDECWIDYRDKNYTYSGGATNDILFEIRDFGSNQYKIFFNFDGGVSLPIATSLVLNKTVKIWHQVGRSGNPIINGGPNKGDFKTKDTLNLLSFPILSTNFNGVQHELPNECGMNLTVDSYHNAKILAGNTFVITNNSLFSIQAYSRLFFETNSKLLIKSGSKFCNYGGTLENSNIIFERRGIFTTCNTYFGVTIGGSMTFEDSAIVEFPDSTTITFDSTAVLTLYPHSVLKLGKLTKLIFQNGARINANNCTFVSYDTTETWDGIYLTGLAYDTLKNCTFQNAVNGINITDNYNPFGSPGAVEISNCTFKNSTGTELLNYVYANNSYNVLVKGCNAVKTGSAGFTTGIIAEYCPAGGLVICDNNINYINTGISLLQSSEYIARNVITGYSNTGSGIYLDNSNGTIEYNSINNFQKSIYGSYSSPYLLKNTLSDAYITNIDLVSNSMPVMKPVISSSTLRWLGGNNTISGYPTNSGIRFADCYPLMDSGYNKIIVNGSDYMNGNFTFSITTVPATINYWFDNPPLSSLFNISSGNVNYSNPFNGSSLPSTDGTELNSIGWGMYDTVFTKSLGDNPTPEDLFTQAYTEEMSQNYTDAITHYKEVISSYKTSEYAPVSLSRIFNCLEKSHANTSDFYSIQGYYSNIKNNSAYPYTTRELSEDFMIKSKVKQYNTEEAISDYETIYQNNQSNSKGAHALLNKYCLQRMVSQDAQNGSTANYTSHKLDILSMITGEDLRNHAYTTIIEPRQYKLHQNYPNPFNPTTNIKYQITNNRSYIKLIVYDITGREFIKLVDREQSPGIYNVDFPGNFLASGVYFYKLEADGFKDVKKMVLIK